MFHFAFDGSGERRQRSNNGVPSRRRPRMLIATAGAAALLALSACTSTGTSAVSASADPEIASSGVTEAAQPYTGIDPSAGAEATDEPNANTATPVSTAEAAPAVTTEVPAPGGAGNIDQTLPAVPVKSNPPVALNADGDYGNGVRVTLTNIESVTTEARLPGEIAGPGIKISVTMNNNSNQPIAVGNVVVDVQDAAGTPALFMTAGATPFSGSIDPGASATGVYVFSVPSTYSNPATISVSYSTEAPVVVFSGDAR